jgi:hypothetical protein
MHERFDLICPAGHRRLASRYSLGAEKHGEHNWTAGMPVAVIVNHMEKHLNLLKAGDVTDDHVAAVAWGAYAIMHYQENCKHQNSELWN